ncbi:P-loop containing nucleoside triphosphate hydrolase protein [Xylogone sp. PMI_703]|nr:P-loop containing nucleoside triphosphate hydrolase protein [Xylogone sp. PMI_703]
MADFSKLQPCLRVRSFETLVAQHSRRPLATAPPKHASSKLFSSSKSRPHLDLPPTALSWYWDTIPPTSLQLSHASQFFESHPPTFLWSAPKFKTMSFGDSPEICFLGRSNVGKSSLLNALLGKKLAHTSSKPGRTRAMNAFAVGGEEDNGKNRLVVLDMPGYGKGGRAEWGEEILKYLEKRKQLRRAFLLVDAEHGVKTGDEQILALFKQQGIPFQVVLSKVDKVLFHGSRMPSQGALEARLADLRRTMETVKDNILPETEDDEGGLGEVISCSSEKWIEGKRLGIDAVRFAMLRAAGLELEAKPKPVEQVEIISHEDIQYLK